MQGFRSMHILVPNRWDHCLGEALRTHLKVKPQRVCCEPLLYHNINWIRAPRSFEPFYKVGIIPTPLAITGDVVALSFDVPLGYDGLIAGASGVYSGPVFQEGGGDLVWRLRINRVYAVDLGQVLVTMGSPTECFPIDGGIQIQSGQRIQYIVAAPNLSGAILPLVTRMICKVEGVFYARS